MNKIQRIVFTMACLLTVTAGYAHKIMAFYSENGTVTATVNSASISISKISVSAKEIESGLQYLRLLFESDVDAITILSFKREWTMMISYTKMPSPTRKVKSTIVKTYWHTDIVKATDTSMANYIRIKVYGEE